MDAVTYPNAEVANFITDRVVPLRVPADAKPLSVDFGVNWTPTLITLDFYGKEHHRTVGFLPPSELIASLLLGMGKADFNTGQYNDAIIHLNTLLNGCAGCGAAPEAVYLRGVCRYKSSHEASALKQAYEQLKADYPGSEWAKRAEPYSLL